MLDNTNSCGKSVRSARCISLFEFMLIVRGRIMIISSLLRETGNGKLKLINLLKGVGQHFRTTKFSNFSRDPALLISFK